MIQFFLNINLNDSDYRNKKMPHPYELQSISKKWNMKDKYFFVDLEVRKIIRVISNPKIEIEFAIDI